MMLACLISGMTIPEEDADVGQGSKYCLVAIGRLQVNKKPVVFILNEGLVTAGNKSLSLGASSFGSPVYSVFVGLCASLW